MTFLFALILGFAAPSGVWDDLADCESGGNWSYNGSSGYDGGLQFSPSTWTAMGGPTQYAWQASRSQQIAVAQRLWEVQGWGAWPGCARKLGLWGINPTQQSGQVDAIADAPEIDPELNPPSQAQAATLSVEAAPAEDNSDNTTEQSSDQQVQQSSDDDDAEDAEEASLPITQ